MRPALLLVALLLGAAASAQGRFFGTADGQIVDPDGEPVLLRGVGLGGWLVPEGYMLHISAPDGGSPRSIRAQIVDLIGEADADRFFEVYRANYVAEADVRQIAAWGYDHVRLPFHYLDVWDPEAEAVRESGFELFDTFLGWCREAGLRVVFDMHAAPGAQNAGNISDSDGEARLWTEPDPYQDWTAAIWTEIARRYASDTLVLGYDLLNEPVLPESVPSSDLRALYVRLADSIRTVDPDHILFIEGNYYATDFGALEEPFDANMVYAFHTYWSAPNQGTIQYLLDLRARTGVPLWLGETGENSTAWFYAMRTLVESHGIGWNWWTHKKIETGSAPASVPFAPGYEALVRYWRGEGSRPTEAAARNALFAQAAALSIERTDRNPDVLAALFDDTYGTTARPFRDHTLPGTVAAVDYDRGAQGVAYADADPWAASGTPGGGNTGGAYRNDGVDIEASSDPQGAPYNVGWIESLERLQYTVTVAEAGPYDVEFRVASGETGGRFALSVDGTSLGNVTVPGTGGWQAWRSVYLRGVDLPAGEHVLTVTVRTGGFNLNTMRFTRTPSTASEEGGPEAADVSLVVAPNPTAGTAAALVHLPRAAAVSVDVVDVLGRLVGALPPADLPPGDHRLGLPLPDAPGLYGVCLTVEDGGPATALTRHVVVGR